MKKQPAHINYFFKGGYVEFWETIKTAFSNCGDEIVDAAEGLSDAWYDMDSVKDALSNVGALIKFEFGDVYWSDFGYAFKAVFGLFFNLFKLICVAIITSAMTVAFSVVHTAILFTFFFIMYVLFGIAKLSDLAYCGIKRIGTSCPRCQEKYSLPSYICECGATHTSLVPSKYGIVSRTCNCKRKLKTTFFNGRHKMPGKWVCPKCGYELGGPLQVDIPIPVIGGPSSGKTCFISMSIAQLESNCKAKYNLDFQYKPNAALGDDYSDNKEQMSQGRLPEKTYDTRLRYYQFYLTPKGEKVKNLISICDVAGETYEDNDEMARQIGFKNATAFLMIVDPLSVTKYREEIQDTINLSQYGASERPMDEIVSALLVTLNNMGCLGNNSKVNSDVAVVFTKGDIPGLEEKIGVTAAKKYMAEHSLPDIYEAQNKLCESFLIEYEEENFLNTLKANFKSIQFFTCSALGHVEDGNSFVPEGVEDPTLWLIDKSSNICLKEKWGKKI